MVKGIYQQSHCNLKPLVWSMFAVICAAVLVVVGVEVHKRRATREAFSSWADWNVQAEGRVGAEGVLNEEGQMEVLRKIDDENNVNESCEMAGVIMPPEWRPTNRKNTCALDMTNFSVRNNCHSGNPLLGYGNAVESIYIEPSTFKCNLRFRDDANTAEMESYKSHVNVTEKLREVTRLKDRVKELENKILDLEQQIKQIREDIAQQERTIDSLNEKILRLKGEIQALKNDVANKKRRIKTLERQISSVQRVQKKVNNIPSAPAS
jgi:uncharacterized coiled-coil protein SlyX